MKVKLNVKVFIDFTNLLSEENVEGAMLALGAHSPTGVIQEFSQKILDNIRLDTEKFSNVLSVDADVVKIEDNVMEQNESENVKKDIYNQEVSDIVVSILSDILKINVEDGKVESVVVQNVEVANELFSLSSTVAIVREDLEVPYVIRYIDKEQNIKEVVC